VPEGLRRRLGWREGGSARPDRRRGRGHEGPDGPGCAPERPAQSCRQRRVVLNSCGRTPGRQAVHARLIALLKRTGLPRHCVHALRHFSCSILVSRGASGEAVRLLSGHSRLDMTQRFVHAAAGDLEAAIAKLSGN
jgi:site-specific recombinase XerD